MKEISRSTRIQFRPLILYKDDLRDLYGLIEANSQSENHTFEIGDYEIENLEDLDKLEVNKTRDLSITLLTPSLVLSLSKSDATLTIFSQDSNSVGLKSIIQDFLQSKERKPRFLSKTIFHLIIAFGGQALVILLSKLSLLESNSIPSLFIIIYSICIYLPTFLYFTHNYSMIYPTTKSNQKSIFSRKKDELVLTLIGALLGGAIALVGKFLYDILK